MRVRIHRGAHEVGGNCVELEVSASRIVLDLGRPLDVDVDEGVELPDIPGLSQSEDGSLLGLILSHPHQDHYGLVAQADPSVPIYMGEAAAAILDAAAFFAPSGMRLQPSGFLEDRVAFSLGASRSRLILSTTARSTRMRCSSKAANGALLLGDFRAHGRKASLVRKLCEHPPNASTCCFSKVLMCAPDELPRGLDESEVAGAMAGTFRSTEGLVVVFSSAQNVDRLITTYKACRSAKRELVVDLYSATVAVATARNTIPQPGFPGLRVYVPNRQRLLVKESREFERVEALRRYRIYPDEIRERAGELVALIQGSTLPELARANCLGRATAIWSLWPGYLDQASGSRTARLLDEQGVALVHLHASGHASIADLQTLAAAMSPARVVPIHTSAPEQFERFFERVELHEDGVWWDA